MNDLNEIPLAGKIQMLTHSFPQTGITALKNLNLPITRGEILAVMGENGAGKSTLMDIISGSLSPSEGSVTLFGEPGEAQRQNLCGMIHQKPHMASNLSVLENIILGKEGTFFRPSILEKEIRGIQEQYGLPLNLNRNSAALSAPEIQRCELIRALWKQKKILILDEPTASLPDSKTAELFKLLRSLKEEGKTILFISHKIHEVMNLADRIAVLRRGELQGMALTSELSPRKISRLMVGEEREYREPPRPRRPRSEEAALLELKGIEYTESGVRRLKKISMCLKPGEIFGIGGIRENGLDQLEDLLTGLLHPQAGEILISGKATGPLSPFQLRRKGISYIPADRLKRGAAPESTVAENLSILKKDLAAFFGSYRKGLLRWARNFITQKNIKAEAGQQVKTLSGGNIQKMIVARELSETPRILIVSEPSWGLDFKSRTILHEQIQEAVSRGSAVLMLTSDLDELLSLSHRAGILTEGELIPLEGTEEQWNRNYAGEIMTGALKL